MPDYIVHMLLMAAIVVVAIATLKSDSKSMKKEEK